MSGTVVGVDIGSASIRAVEVRDFDTAKPVLVRAHEVPVPDTSVRRGEVIEVATVATALRRLWATGRFGSKKVVLGIGGTRVFARDLAVPRAPLEQIRESLPFLVQDLLPVPVPEAVLDYYPVSENGSESGSEVSGLLVAAVKEAVNANVSAVINAGLDPVHVDLIPFALVRAMTPRRTSKGREVVVSLGANTTNVVVVSDGVPHFVRIIPNGADDITRALATRLQWAPERAEQTKRSLGMGTAMLRPEDRPAIEIIYEVVGELLSSVRNTLSYYANAKPNEPVGRILLSGGGAQMTGVPNALAALTGLPVAVAEPLEQVASKVRERRTAAESDRFVVAFGLARGSHQ